MEKLETIQPTLLQSKTEDATRDEILNEMKQLAATSNENETDTE